jgi:hypothetical protein
MPDVEFGELRDRRNRLDIVEGEPMARMHLDAVLRRKRGCVGQPAQLLRPRLAFEFRIAAGVELDDGAPRRSAASTCAGSGSMNRLTRMFAPLSARTIGAR